MLIEMRTYMLVPGGAAKWLAAYEAKGMAIQLPILGRLIGYFSTEIGPLNQIVHMWGYDSFEDRMKRRAELGAHPGWRAYLDETRALVVTQESKLLVGAPFSPIK